MKFNDPDLEYLKGKKFSNSRIFQYDYYAPIPNRVKLLTELVKGKNVLHLGCLDHLPLIEEKIKQGQWLHKELTDNAKQCLGIDIDSETRQFVQTKFGYSNIMIGDFARNRLTEVTRTSWDYAVLGELLEHIDNPVEYLSSIQSNYRDCIERIIITVPNAWTQTTIKKALQSSEIINTDHRYWFTPYTLSKVIVRANMQVEEILFANRVQLSTAELIYKKMLTLLGQEPRYNFTYSSSIVAIARFASS